MNFTSGDYNPTHKDSPTKSTLERESTNYSSFYDPNLTKYESNHSIASVDSSVSRLYMSYSKHEYWIEEQRVKKYLIERLAMQKIPKINQNSRTLYANKLRPIHERINEIIKQRETNLNRLQKESEDKKNVEETKECTFRPKSATNTPRSIKVELNKQKFVSNKLSRSKSPVLKKQVCIAKSSNAINRQRAKTPVLQRLVSPDAPNVLQFSPTARFFSLPKSPSRSPSPSNRPKSPNSTSPVTPVYSLPKYLMQNRLSSPAHKIQISTLELLKTRKPNFP